jgi:hypothetical protein
MLFYADFGTPLPSCIVFGSAKNVSSDFFLLLVQKLPFGKVISVVVNFGLQFTVIH